MSDRLSLAVHHPPAANQPAIVHARCYPPDHRCNTARARAQRQTWPVMIKHVYPAQRLCRLRLYAGRGWTLSPSTQARARRAFKLLERESIFDTRHLLRVEADGLQAALPIAVAMPFLYSLVAVAVFVRVTVRS